MALDNVVPIDADTARLLARRRVHFRWFVGLLALVYVSALVPVLLFTPLPPLGPFALLAVLVVLAEHRFVLFGDETSMSASIIVVVASVFVFADSSPLAGPLLIGSLGGLYLPHLRRGSFQKAVLNASGMGLAALVSAIAGLSSVEYTDSSAATVVVVLVVVAIYWLGNNGVVAGYLTVAHGQPFFTTIRCLLVSETAVLVWTILACLAVSIANGNLTLGIALTALVVAYHVVDSILLHHRVNYSQQRSHWLQADRCLLGWCLAIAVLSLEGTPRIADIIFAVVVVLLTRRHHVSGQPLPAILLPIAGIATLAFPWPGACLLLAVSAAVLLHHPLLAWSACVTIAATTWALISQIAPGWFRGELPIALLLALMVPTLISFALYGIRSCRVVDALDSWILLGFLVPTRGELLVAFAIGIVAMSVEACALIAISTAVLVTTAWIRDFNVPRSSQSASH